MAASTAEVVQLFADGVLFALAAALLVLNFRGRANRAFALLLVLRAMAGLTYRMGGIAEELAQAEFWWRVYPYFVFPLTFVPLVFASVYPHPRSWRPGRPLSLLAIVVALVVVEGLYVADHALFWDLGSRSEDMLGPAVDAKAGPLFVFDALFLLSYAGMALLFACDHARLPPGPVRRATLLVALGFAVVVVFDSVGILIAAPNYVWERPPALAAALAMTLALALVVTLAAAVVVLRHARATADAADARAARLTMGWLAAAAASALLLALAPGEVALVYIFAAFWRLALPVLVTYALVRHQLFDVDFRIKRGLKASTLTAAFVAVFFIVSEGAAAFLSDRIGTFMGILAAGLLVFALAPLHRLASRLSEAAMPGVKAASDMTPGERETLYRDIAETAWADGQLQAREARFLATMRERLDLDPAVASRIEDEAARAGARGQRAPPAGDDPTPL